MNIYDLMLDPLFDLEKYIEIKDKEIEQLNNIIKVMEKYFELIVDLSYDYDGFNTVEDLKTLIDELCRYAGLGKAHNTTEPIFINSDKKYNILNEELKEEEKKIPEKLNVISWDKCIHEVTHKEKELAIEINKTQEAINKIIDYLDYLASKGE